MRGVYPHGRKKVRTEVTIQYPSDLTITRMKNPEHLQVTTQGHTLYGESAQSFINSRMGSQQLFTTAGYIQQGMRSGMMISSQSDRMQLINELSFQDFQPDKLHSKISENLKSLQMRLLQLTPVYESKVTEYNSMYNQRQPNFTEMKTAEHIQVLIKEHQHIQSTLNDLKVKIDRNNFNMGMRKAIQSSLDEQTNTLNSIYPTSQEDISKIQGNVNDLIRQLDRRRTWETLLQRKMRIEASIPEVEDIPDLEVTDQLIDLTLRQQWQWQEHSKMLASLGECDDTSRLEEKLTSLNESMSQASLRDQLANTLRIKTELDSIPEYDIDPQYINELKSKLGLNTMQCPGCSQSLKLVGSKLELCSEGHIDSDAIQRELHDLSMKQRSNERRRTLCNSINPHYLNISLDEFKLKYDHIINGPDPMTISRRISEVRYRLDRLLQIKSSDAKPPQYDPEHLRALKNKRELIASIPKIEDCDIQEDSFTLQTKITQLSNELSRMKANMDRYQSVQAEITKLTNQLTSIPVEEGLEEQMKTLQDRSNELNRSIDESAYSQQMMTRLNSLKVELQEIQVLQSHIQACSNLKVNAIQEECDLLEGTVSIINSTLEVILPLIFEEDIQVQLGLFRELKSTKQIKPQVNFSIFYRGVEYDSINQLSGGEADRISMALAIACSKISSCPILLLDECMASLDSQYRELCLKCIRLILSDKIVLCINHEDNEALYDSCIRVV